MPYFTKKGTGKDKGKTCVYKKEGKTRVGCTAGPIEKYMAALHIHETEELDWLSGPAQIRLGDIKDSIEDYLSVGDIIYVSGTLAMGEYEELNPNNSIELDMEPVIVKGFRGGINGGINVIFGNNITTLPLWTSEIANDWVDMGHISTDDDLLITIPEKKSVTESEENDLDWIKDIGGDTDSLIAQLKTHIKEHVPVAHLELDWDQTSGGGEYFGRVWLYDRFYELYKYGKTFTVRFYERDPRTDQYHQYDQYENLVQTRLLTILLNELIDYNRKNLSESEEDDWEWAKEIEADQLIPGEIYDIKTGNGYYWVPELFVGKKWDDEYNIEMYKFKDLDGSGSGAKSTPYVKELIQKGHIRPYDPNWSIKDELTFSDNLEDALKGNFVIYFKDGVYLDQTLAIQDRLFEMGFSFYTKGPNEYITNKDSSGKIQFFECFNWDTSNPRYRSMPPNQWDLKKILLVKVSDEDTRWRRTRNPRLEEQELFLTVSNHDAIVINGDKYTTNNITESEEFDWIRQQEPEKKLKKTKSYVVDVSHLRPKPMRYSHDPSLTRQDILHRFKDLGYNTEDIDVDEAKYFYIEPNQGTGWQYNEYGTPIDYDYWIDYNTHHMEDPSYGGKYQVISIDELMFLLDNNLISESEEDSLGWIRDIDISPEFIALQIFKNTKIIPNAFMDSPMIIVPFTYLQYSRPIMFPEGEFNKYIKNNYNIDDTSYTKDIWNLWVYYVEEKLKKINESNFKESINEVAGISFESRKWADIIYKEIISNPEEKTRLIIDGYDYPEAFDQFPIDYIVIDYYDRITGYGQEHSGYDQDGNYVVLLYVQPKLVQGQGGYSLKSALNHEMKHAWEDYNRISRGKPNIEQTKESKELYNRDFILLMSDNNIVGPIKDVLKYFYYLSKLEVSPYLENVYDENPAYENMVRQITTKDFESFKNRFDLDINWHLINTAYDIPFVKKFKSPREFIDYSAKELRKRATKILKKINKMKYIHGKI